MMGPDAILERLREGLAASYRVDSPIGAGGMALVFGASDLRHDRAVAIKVLRPEIAEAVGAERFLREIQVTAQLQHPHILPLFDSGAIGPLLYYVMPLVPGETLRQRLNRERQLPVDETVALLRALAGALEYAHRKGVLHRDIKPENILLQDGQPLLADFGISLGVGAGTPGRLTSTGLSIGTPSYMSPEQVSGERLLDARSDQYALACVGYECLVGEPPFTGPTLQALVAAALTETPRSIVTRRPTVPAPLAAAIHRALERLPSDRFSSMASFANALTAEFMVPTPPASRSLRGRALSRGGVLAAGLALAVGAIAGRMSAPASAVAERHWHLVLDSAAPVALGGSGPSAGWPTAIAVAPDGERLVYVASRGGSTELRLRGLSGDSAIVLPGTEGASHPVFSPDGEWVAFFAGEYLRKVAVAGGPSVALVKVDRVTGAAWAAPDRILLLENEGFNLRWVSPSGGASDSVIALSTQFGSPDVLPGGTWAVGQLSSGQLALLSLEDGTELAVTRRGILPLDSVRPSDLLFGTSPRYLESGHLLYATDDGVLAAMPFDGRRRRVQGAPATLLSGVRMEAGFGYAEFAVSRDGTLLYVPGRNQFYVNIVLVSPNGRVDTLPFPRGPYTQPRLSRDGTRLAVQTRTAVGGWEVELLTLESGQRQRLEVDGNYRAFPASWLPSGRELLVGTWDPVRFVNYGARVQSLETGQYRPIALTGASYMTVSPDGSGFVFSDWRTGELFFRRLEGDTARQPLPGRGFAASFSRDGRWVAWGDLDGGVSASPMPPTGAVYRLAERGQMPLWGPDGNSLIYRDGGRYYRMPIRAERGLQAGRATLLADGPFLATFAWNHDVMPDGRLLALLRSPEREAPVLGVIAGFDRVVARRTDGR